MTDRYTKFVLTVIAVCLLYSTAKDFVGAAYAQNRIDMQAIQSATPVRIVAVGPATMTDGILEVRIQK